jgi:2-phospho-L-lactate guanylyltransferase
MSDHRVIVPVKGLKESKTRLSSFLVKEKRELLVKALLQDVLKSLQGSDVFTSIVVVSPDHSVSEAIQSGNVAFLRQTGTGLNAAVQQAISTATKSRAESLTIALADVPMAEPRDFAELFNLGGNQAKVVLAPSLKGGTNTMFLSPPSAIPPGYGRWSYAKHLREAQRRKLNVYSVSNSRLSFDIDTAKDLVELRRLDPNGRTDAGKLVNNLVKGPVVPIKHEK